MITMIMIQVRMECEVVADTSVSLSVTWKKDNIDLGTGDSGERITVDRDQTQSSIFMGTGKYTTTLVIKMVNFEDEGQHLNLVRILSQVGLRVMSLKKAAFWLESINIHEFLCKNDWNSALGF